MVTKDFSAGEAYWSKYVTPYVADRNPEYQFNPLHVPETDNFDLKFRFVNLRAIDIQLQRRAIEEQGEGAAVATQMQSIAIDRLLGLGLAGAKLEATATAEDDGNGRGNRPCCFGTFVDSTCWQRLG
mmetsp:Transcript_26702/g.67288  ORF Transcript_26702/g.67288 Transcript_26702/m.67288 type:complete len:127 (-) Transcript_26702:1245-1625(-)